MGFDSTWAQGTHRGGQHRNITNRLEQGWGVLGTAPIHQLAVPTAGEDC